MKINIEAHTPTIHTADTPLTERIISALKEVYDPELPVNIYDLGLIYGIEETAGDVKLTMTLTAPNCPVADMIVQQAEEAVRQIEGVKSSLVTLVWEPKWTKEMISDAAKLELGWYE